MDWTRRQALALAAAGGMALVGRSAGAASAGPTLPADGAGTAVDVVLGTKRILVAQTSQIHQYPDAFAWDKVVDGQVVGRYVRVRINRQPDDWAEPPQPLFMYTTNAGATWQQHNPQAGLPSIELTNSTRTQLGFGFSTTIIPGSGNKKAKTGWSRSEDSGSTFTSGTSTVETTRPIRISAEGRTMLLLHGRALEAVTSGTIYQPAYGLFDTDVDGVRRSILLQSSDLGVTWAERSTIGYDPDLLPGDPDYEGLGETSVARLADGSLLAVIRTGAWPPHPLYSARSTNDGLSWSPVQRVQAGSNHEDVLGINPKLRLLPNGMLVLMTGRNLIRLYVSEDGTGDSWGPEIVVSNMGYESGNAGMDIIDDGQVIVVGDRRSNLRPADPDYRYEIWSRTATLAPNP